MNLMSFNYLQFSTILLSDILCVSSWISDFKTAPSKTYVTYVNLCKVNNISTVAILDLPSRAQSFPARNREKHHEDPL